MAKSQSGSDRSRCSNGRYDDHMVAYAGLEPDTFYFIVRGTEQSVNHKVLFSFCSVEFRIKARQILWRGMILIPLRYRVECFFSAWRIHIAAEENLVILGQNSQESGEVSALTGRCFPARCPCEMSGGDSVGNPVNRNFCREQYSVCRVCNFIVPDTRMVAVLSIVMRSHVVQRKQRKDSHPDDFLQICEREDTHRGEDTLRIKRLFKNRYIAFQQFLKTQDIWFFTVYKIKHPVDVLLVFDIDGNEFEHRLGCWGRRGNL